MRIKYILQNIDMRCTQTGLKAIFETKKGTQLSKQDFCLFVNRNQTQLKLLSWDFKMCISYKSGYGRLNPVIFTTLHEYWDGNSFDFKKAEYNSLLRSLNKKGISIRNK